MLNLNYMSSFSKQNLFFSFFCNRKTSQRAVRWSLLSQTQRDPKVKEKLFSLIIMSYTIYSQIISKNYFHTLVV